MFASASKLIVALTALSLSLPSGAQSELQKRTLVVNGSSGETIVYRISGRTYISLEALAQIGNGSLSFQGDTIVLTFPPVADPPARSGDESEMTPDFMKTAIQTLASIKEWHTALAHAIQRGAPGDGSRLVVFHDRAAAGLRLTTVATTSPSDQNALHLLSNHFNRVDEWTRKLVQERKSMSTASYSLTPNALDNDSQYQQIASCSKFLGTMLARGRFEDDASCH